MGLRTIYQTMILFLEKTLDGYKNIHCKTYQIEGEDHSFAIALRYFLHRNPHVEFCAYSIPHPADNLINIRIQTTGKVSTLEAMYDSLFDLKKMCQHVKTIFNRKNVHISDF